MLVSPWPDKEGNKLGSTSRKRAISTTSRRELSSSFFFPARQGAEGNSRYSDRNISFVFFLVGLRTYQHPCTGAPLYTYLTVCTNTWLMPSPVTTRDAEFAANSSLRLHHSVRCSHYSISCLHSSIRAVDVSLLPFDTRRTEHVHCMSKFLTPREPTGSGYRRLSGNIMFRQCSLNMNWSVLIRAVFPIA